jgi:dTDP-4-amino-4,6-dideoxygalactose transaminase
MKIPFLSFDETNRQIKKTVLESIEATFDSKWYVLGKNVKEFEEQYASFSDVKYCVGVGNGLEALHLGLKALEVKEGDEVIVPSNTYIATVLAVSYTGATPVFVEPNPLTYNIDPKNIEDAITAKTKVIIPVHLYGQACEMDEIMDIANAHNIYVLEDNAQSQAATYNGKITGSFGQVNATSFYPGKNLGALGDGGAITTNSEEIAEKIKVLRNYGSPKKYVNEVIGYNSRLDELQAGVLSVKLSFLENWSNERREIADWYTQYLPSSVIKPTIHEKAKSVFHLYVIQCQNREDLQKHLTRQGIGSLIHYPIPPHLQEAYRDLGYSQGDFPIAEKLAKSVLSLPLFIGMTEAQVKNVCGEIEKFYDA